MARDTGLLCVTLCACGAGLVQPLFQPKTRIRRSKTPNPSTSVAGWKSFEGLGLELDISITDNRAATTKEVKSN